MNEGNRHRCDTVNHRHSFRKLLRWNIKTYPLSWVSMIAVLLFYGWFAWQVAGYLGYRGDVRGHVSIDLTNGGRISTQAQKRSVSIFTFLGHGNKIELCMNEAFTDLAECLFAAGETKLTKSAWTGDRKTNHLSLISRRRHPKHRRTGPSSWMVYHREFAERHIGSDLLRQDGVLQSIPLSALPPKYTYPKLETIRTVHQAFVYVLKRGERRVMHLIFCKKIETPSCFVFGGLGNDAFISMHLHLRDQSHGWSADVAHFSEYLIARIAAAHRFQREIADGFDPDE